MAVLSRSGGTVHLMVKSLLCSDVAVLSNLSSLHSEYLAVKCHSFHLPWEFTTIIMIVLYVPLQAGVLLALEELYIVGRKHQMAYPGTGQQLWLQHPSLKDSPTNYQQHVSCSMRIKSFQLLFNYHCLLIYPSFWKIRRLGCASFYTWATNEERSSAERIVQSWTGEVEKQLIDYLASVDWPMFNDLIMDLNEYVMVATDFIMYGGVCFLLSVP